MGLFDQFLGKKPAPRPAASPPVVATPAPASEKPAAPATPVVTPPPTPGAERKPAPGGVLPRLAEAREKLKARDLPGARAIYDEVLAGASERADVLVTISADLGTNGHMHELIELLAPRYDAEKHGAAAGINLLQAYLVTRDAEAAQHLLDLLFSLRRPELEARLVGFSNAVADLFVTEAEAAHTSVPDKQISLASFSKPMWVYGLDAFEAQLLPRKTGRLRRVAFAQLALPGTPDTHELAAQPEEERGRLSRAVALWLAETFASSAGFSPLAAVGIVGQQHYALFPTEWTAENFRQLNESSGEGLDYVVTGWLRVHHADYEAGLRIWEMKKSRELKSFTTKWTPATADEALGKLHAQLRAYMEWTELPAGHGIAYAPPPAPFAYLHALGASLSLFLVEKGVLPAAHAATDPAPILAAARAMPEYVRANLLLVTALQRLKARGVTLDPGALEYARAWLASDAARAAGLAGLEL